MQYLATGVYNCNGLFRGVLCTSNETQRVCTVLVQLLLIVFDLAYHLSSEYRNCRLSNRCTIINTTLYSNSLLRQKVVILVVVAGVLAVVLQTLKFD